MSGTSRPIPGRTRTPAAPPAPASLSAVQCLHTAQLLTWIAIALTAIAAAVGLFVPGVYRDTEWAIPQMRGQDLVTLLALPVLAWAVVRMKRGSSRAALLWVGLLGYIFYTYTGAAFAYHLNVLFLVYVALFSLGLFALAAAAAGLDSAAIHRSFDTTAPRRGVAIFMLVFAALLTVLWVGQLIPFFTTGALPTLVVLADTPTNFVYVLDLGLVVPLALLAAWWLWKDHAWGPVVAGYVLVKCVAMALALISMTIFVALAGQPFEWGLAAFWVLLAVSSIGMTFWYLRHCRN